MTQCSGKLDAAAASVRSTYLGGSGWDEAWAWPWMALNGVYVAGRTNSINFPTKSGLSRVLAVERCVSDPLRLADSSCRPPHLSSYFWRQRLRRANDLDVDDPGNSYLIGQRCPQICNHDGG